MTVQELRSKLATCPDDMPVVLAVGEGHTAETWTYLHADDYTTGVCDEPIRCDYVEPFPPLVFLIVQMPA